MEILVFGLILCWVFLLWSRNCILCMIVILENYFFILSNVELTWMDFGKIMIMGSYIGWVEKNMHAMCLLKWMISEVNWLDKYLDWTWILIYYFFSLTLPEFTKYVFWEVGFSRIQKKIKFWWAKINLMLHKMNRCDQWCKNSII